MTEICIEDFIKLKLPNEQNMYSQHKDRIYHRGSRLSREQLRANIMENAKECENTTDQFSSIYLRWLPVRQNSLRKLKALKSKVHEDQLDFNTTQYVSREIGYHSRSAKRSTNSEAVEFLGSLGAFVSEVVSRVASVAQAVNIDLHKTKLEEIMKEDAEFTKRLHTARSRCIVKYRGIEEIIRNLDSTTFDSTVDSICASLNVGKHWISISNAYRNDDMSTVICSAKNLMENACRPETVQEIHTSVKTYLDDNPAALNACKSTSRAIFTAADTWGRDKKKDGIVEHLSRFANEMMMAEDRKEADRLCRVIDQNSSQAKLETQIEQAIDDLNSEMTEIIRIYSELF